MKTIFFLSIIVLSSSALSAGPTKMTKPEAQKSTQLYTLETPGGGEFQSTLSLGLQTGTLRASTASETSKVEGLTSTARFQYGLSEMFSLGFQTNYLNSTEKDNSTTTKKTGLGDGEFFFTGLIPSSSWNLYFTLLGGSKITDFEIDSVSRETSNSSGSYFIEPSVAASTDLGSWLNLGAAAAYRFHFSRNVEYTSSSGTESLSLDPANWIRVQAFAEVPLQTPLGLQLDWISQDKAEAFSLRNPGQKVVIGNTALLTASGYVRILLKAGSSDFEITPWVSYQINSNKKRGSVNYDEDQLLTLALNLRLTL